MRTHVNSLLRYLSATPSIAVAVVLTLSFLLSAKPLPGADHIVHSETSSATAPSPIDLASPRYRELFHELKSAHGFTREELDGWFRGVSINPKILELIDKPREARPWFRYLALLFTPAIVETGKAKLAEHKELFERIEQQFGVNREYIAAIWGIETRFGSNPGKYELFRTLNTLFSAYPRREQFFRKQLIHLLLLSRENGIDPRSISGSYAGAFGQPQFIPSSFREYAVSFDGDDRRDMFHSIPDILASIANYLHRHHWTLDAPVYVDIGRELKSETLVEAQAKGRKGRVSRQTVTREQDVDLPASPGDASLIIFSVDSNPLFGGGQRHYAGYPNFQAIVAWNHSNMYAMAVSRLAEAMTE